MPVTLSEMNSIVIEKTPETADALANCEVGVPETFTITATPLSVSDTVVVFQIDSVEYSGQEEVEPEAEAAPEDSTAKPYKPKAKADSATAVTY